jgi:two-component sensor histidine kinase
VAGGNVPEWSHPQIRLISPTIPYDVARVDEAFWLRYGPAVRLCEGDLDADGEACDAPRARCDEIEGGALRRFFRERGHWAASGRRWRGAINVLVDITERKRADEEQKILIDELNHRVKNTLATVQSISMHTHRSTPEAFVPRFEGRLVALSKAHDLLTRRRWTGVGLGELLKQELAPYVDADQSRIGMEGPGLTLSARTGLALSMVLHELVTNAAKYGALSAERGRVRVVWSPKAEGTKNILTLRWIESGAPRGEPPTRRGFGRQLIKRSITKDLAGLPI